MTKFAIAIIIFCIVGGTLFSSYQSLAKKERQLAVLTDRVKKRERLERHLSQGSYNVAATRLIKQGEIVTRNAVVAQRMERGFCIGTFGSIDQVVGRRVKNYDVQKGEVLSHEHFEPSIGIRAD
jgi:hypothetical protein